MEEAWEEILQEIAAVFRDAGHQEPFASGYAEQVLVRIREGYWVCRFEGPAKCVANMSVGYHPDAGLHENCGRAVLRFVSQEQTPDYEAAKGQIVKLVVLAEDADPLADDWEFWARTIVDAALVGFHPNPKETRDERL